MDERDKSHIESSLHEQSWQIVRKQGAIFIKGMNIIVNKGMHSWKDHENYNWNQFAVYLLLFILFT